MNVNEWMNEGTQWAFATRDWTILSNLNVWFFDDDVTRFPNVDKSNQFISETADSKIEIQDNDNVQPLTEVRKRYCISSANIRPTSNTAIILKQ